MEKLLETVDQQTSSAVVGAVAEEQLDEGLFHQFMVRNPIWDFHSLSREQYIVKGRGDELALIRQYYYEMKNGGHCFFSFVFWKVSVATSESLVS